MSMMLIYAALAHAMAWLRWRDGLDACNALGVGWVWPLALLKDSIDALVEVLALDRFNADVPGHHSTS